jgi:hypothetical protein
MVTKQRRSDVASRGGVALKEALMPAKLVHDPRIASQNDDIMWLNPGVNRNMSSAAFNELFAGCDSICRATRTCRLASPQGAGEEHSLSFQRGDVIAATTVEHEGRLQSLLQQRGLTPQDAAFGEGPGRAGRGRT